MPKITGLGGAFLRVENPKTLITWYEEHLGLKSAHGTFVFPT